MMMSSEAPELRARIGREGSRWYNERPLPTEVAEWFSGIPLHPGMSHEKYVNGIVLIPGKEKSDEIVGYDDHGFPQVRSDVQHLTWTPYMKVETRVAYFWDWVAQAGNGAWTGSIEPAGIITKEPSGLPPGFFSYRATSPKAEGKEVRFVGASFRVRVVDSYTGRVVLEGGLGTKIVQTATKWDVDPNAVMKAETGAIGRALGVAGMLVMPGSGIATAEDMAENLAPSAPAITPEGAAVPEDVPAPVVPEQPDDDVLRVHIGELLKVLAKDHPPYHVGVIEWMVGRKLPFLDDTTPKLEDFTSMQLKGTVKKLERVLDEQTRQG
jgi:hypothetical protein